MRLSSYYISRDNILRSSILAFEAEKYHSLEASGKDVYKSLVAVKAKVSKSLNSIILKPQQTKYYDLVDIENYFNFNVGTNYLVKLYIPHMSIYVDKKFVGTTSVKSNTGEIIFPASEAELR